MKMKKIAAAVMMLSMVAVTAVGCGSSNGTDTKGADANQSDATSDWDETSDVTIVSREDGSGTRGAFIELFGIEEKQDDGTKVDMTTTDAQITNNTSVMLTTVADNEYAIGYVSLGSLNDSVKALKIDGAEATAENIENGSYKVSRPFNIAVKKDLNNKVAKDFMSFIMSTEGQKVVADEKYIGCRCKRLCRNKAFRKLCSWWFFFCIPSDGETDRGLQSCQPECKYRASDIRFYNRYDFYD